MLTREVLKTVTRSWDLELLRPRYDIPIAGSPERCLFRVVVEEIEGRLYILEQIDPRSLPQKHRIAHTLNLLHLRGLQTVRPYLSGRRSEFIARIPEGDWQIAPYISGVELSRPGYAVEAWRGEVLAEFLMALRAKTREGLPDYSGSRPFSLPAFIEDLMHRLQRHDPEVYRRVLAAWRHLKLGWTAAHDQTPTAFCHGDFHPLNVVWTKDGIACVIDWEFSG